MELKVLNEDGKQVDWWFMYKLPDDVKPTKGAAAKFKETKGNEYLYYDSGDADALALSGNKIDGKKGALWATLDQIYSAGDDASLGWICYNDEIPDTEDNDGEKGHTKGALAFDLESDTAIWLLHSWPKFADPNSGGPGAANYGQTYLCIQLDGVETARTIAKIMRTHQEPQTYQNRVPKALKDDDPLALVATSVEVSDTDPPAVADFKSAGSGKFKLFAKNRHWGEDFWVDLVGPKLDVDMDVETWRRGTVPPKDDGDGEDDITDILYLNVEHLGVPYEWHYTKDHSKWGISEKEDWVCIADINRQTSQEKRGGGAICFRDKNLWKALCEIEQLKK